MAKLQALYGGEGGDGKGDIAVTPGNWLALRVFLAQDGRWLRAPTGRATALDMTQVDATLRLMGAKRGKRRQVFWQLLKMEAAALVEMAR